MAGSATSAPPFQVSDFMGPYILEMCLALILYGVTTTQAYIYTLNCKKDSTVLKIWVSAVWVLETIHTSFLLRQFWFCAISGFGDYAAVASIDWSIVAIIFAENCIIGLVQGFYIRRICILSGRNLFVTAFLVFILVVRIALHTTIAAYASFTGTWTVFAEHVPATVSNALGAVLDGSIAFCMIFYLSRSETAFNRTKDVIRWLIAFSVNTGATSMAASISVAITYSCLKNTLTFVGIAAIVSKLYSNSFLGALNSREFLQSRTQRTAITPDSPGFSSKFPHASDVNLKQQPRPGGVSFGYSQESSVNTDNSLHTYPEKSQNDLVNIAYPKTGYTTMV